MADDAARVPGDPEARLSLPEVHGTVPVFERTGVLRRMFAIAGPAYLVSVGYVDPGNWATDIAAGSAFDYALLWVLLVSNVMAVLLQSLACRLGVGRGLDLAQACRAEYGRGVNVALWLLCEIAITACDLAEVLGSAIALKLLFGLPLVWGVAVSAADTFVLLFLGQFGIRKLEALILVFLTVIAGGFLVEVFLARPDWAGVASGLVPSLPGPGAVFVALGMLGATVMPHNLYLHSSLVQTRRIGRDVAVRRQAIRLNTFDSAIALNVAFFVNAAILVVSAAVFHRAGHTDVVDIQQAHGLLDGLLGSAWAPAAFAVALLASGQSSTVTGTLAGQVVMEGFLAIRIPQWLRRLVTRLAAIVPAVITIAIAGDRGVGELLVVSQVVLALQLPFAAVPLIQLVSDREGMGELVLARPLRVLAWCCAGFIVALNGWLVADTVARWRDALGPAGRPLLWALLAALGGILSLLVYVTLKPLLDRLTRARARARAAPDVHEAAGFHLDLAAGRREYRRVAVALDLSGRESEVLRETLQLVGPSRPRLALLHVVESAGARFLGREVGDAEAHGDSARLQAYAAELRGLGFEVECHLGLGKRVPELARMVGEFGADLLVVGVHGHRFFSDLVHGSTVDALRHRVSCSVLLVGKAAAR